MHTGYVIHCNILQHNYPIHLTQKTWFYLAAHVCSPTSSHGVWTATPALTEDQQIAVRSLACVGRSAHFVAWYWLFARLTMQHDNCSMSMVARLHLLDYISQCAGPHVYRDSWKHWISLHSHSPKIFEI